MQERNKERTEEENGGRSRTVAVPLTPQLLDLIYQSIRFSEWAAGEGIYATEGENAEAPEDFILRYAQATDGMDCEDFATAVRTLLSGNSHSERAVRSEESAKRG